MLINTHSLKFIFATNATTKKVFYINEQDNENISVSLLLFSVHAQFLYINIKYV